MSDSSQLPPMQLSMSITRVRILQLPDASAPKGYELRGYRKGDEQGWVDLLQYGDFSEWDLDVFEKYIAQPERLEGSRVVCQGNEIVVATFASQQDEAAQVASIDYVICHPEHRGNGLGRVVCTSVMKYLAARAYQSVILYTDDWRLPAIGLYLSLGFEPQMTRDDMPARWEAIRGQLRDSVN